jgi:hypothetical protein
MATWCARSWRRLLPGCPLASASLPTRQETSRSRRARETVRNNRTNRAAERPSLVWHFLPFRPIDVKKEREEKGTVEARRVRPGVEYSHIEFARVFARIPTEMLLSTHYAPKATTMNLQPRDIPTFLSDIKLLTNTQICR